ncbi:DUF4105 domain-containing protein [Plebeiibacterium sediminum]|uniref:DUF4105 domain-containing protein n=1 Tax=Plebeiibacterium sediminum TaxID=2992112 RepID=A0AAE3M5X5_9BACT|nr:DUF4105 domain-containing protein [Plebeiobacterium sediminum]MCW3787856.1 DUF4105 domain-containing protein [Plebeiobacterium sediminum]
MDKFIHRLVLILLFSITTLNINSANKLSDQATISVLTCSEGEELYSAFGHSAIRVCDKPKNIDYVFNYGTFNFNTPNFYLKFANGKLNYMISYGYFKRFLPEYFRENRSVNEQILNLNANEKQRIFDALVTNYKPENRFYKYDFFYDNCATRIYKIISENIDGEIVIDDNTKEQSSFRMYLHHYLENSPWIETGLNILLGLPTDKNTTHVQSAFLPDFLMQLLDQVKVKDGNEIKKLVISNTLLLERDENSIKQASLITPSIAFWLLLCIVISMMLINKAQLNKVLRVFDRTLFMVVGFIGLLLLYLWLITDHQVTRYNLNILWSFPTFLIIGIKLAHSKFIKLVMTLNLFLLVIFIVGWYIIPQSFPPATLPLAIILGIRVVFNLKSDFYHPKLAFFKES